jgi:hypothetical protein
MFSGCTSFRVSPSWFYGSCTSNGMSIFVPADASYWMSSSMGVKCTGVVSGMGFR